MPSMNQPQNSPFPVVDPVPGYVLIVEDDEEIRDALQNILEMENFRVKACANGKEGLDFLLTAPDLPAIMILDLMMPVMSGWDMLQAMRGHPELAAIPVLISSAVHTEDELPVAGFLKKPYSLNILIHEVRRLGFPQ